MLCRVVFRLFCKRARAGYDGVAIAMDMDGFRSGMEWLNTRHGYT